jgi:hypothetical protein
MTAVPPRPFSAPAAPTTGRTRATVPRNVHVRSAYAAGPAMKLRPVCDPSDRNRRPLTNRRHRGEAGIPLPRAESRAQAAQPPCSPEAEVAGSNPAGRALPNRPPVAARDPLGYRQRRLGGLATPGSRPRAFTRRGVNYVDGPRPASRAARARTPLCRASCGPCSPRSRRTARSSGARARPAPRPRPPGRERNACRHRPRPTPPGSPAG